jgi:endonuclease/exonuclease/phosphatase family metal-dependent hydrolase
MDSFYSVLSIGLVGLMLAGCAERSPAQTDHLSVTAMSYNLRFDNPDDGENRWDNRKEQAAALINFHRPGFLGTQEGLLHQLEYLDEELSGYEWIGVGRDDGGEEGEFSALFYDNEKFELVEGSEQTIWLSETPGEPSKAWDAALPRILTFGQFRDRDSGREFWVFNTHFDHVGDTARAESAQLIVDTIREQAAEDPVILTGDFNVTEEMEPYGILTDSESPLRDTYHATEAPHLGPDFTYEGFEVRNDQEKRRIDYIFVNDAIEVKNHAIITSFRDGRYPSDHLPVMVRLGIE